MKKFKVFAAALAICAVSVTAGGCSDDNKVGKWFDQLLCTHEWDDGEVTKEATCASKGEIKYTCESCEKTKTKKTDKLPHTEVEIELEATCTKEGLTDGVKCAVCEEVLQQPKVVAKIPHFEVPNSEAVAATCTTAGLKPGTHCARCDEVITEETVIPALGHLEVPDTAVEATCTTSGLTEGKHCKRCNEVLEAQETVPAILHTDENDDGNCDGCGGSMSVVAVQEVSFTTGKITDTWYRVYLYRLCEDVESGKIPGIVNHTVEFTSTEKILTNGTEKFVVCVNPAGIGLLYCDVPTDAYTDDIVVEWHGDLGYVDFYIPSGTVLTTPETGGYPANYNGELTAEHEWSINEALSPYVVQLIYYD